MKRFELTIAILLIPIDAVMLIAAALTAYYLRFEGIVTKYRPVLFELDFSAYLELVLPLVGVWVIIFALIGLYSIQHPRKIIEEIKKVFVAATLGFAAITMFLFLSGELFNSRFIVLAGALIAIVYVSLARLVVRLVKYYFYKNGIGVKRVILVGNDKTAKAISSFIKTHPRYGLMVVKKIRTADKENLKRLEQELSEAKADLVLQASVRLDKKDTERLLDFAKQNHLQFSYVADVFDTKAVNTDTTTIADTPVIEIKQTPLEGWGRIFKRTFDVVIGLLFVVVASPIMLIVAIAIKLDSKGPVIYKNERVGKNGKVFYAYKFRRMRIDVCTGADYDETGKAERIQAELIKNKDKREGPLYKISDDPRNTRVGRFIEKTSLDEFPQFFNVILGNMSLVGPRPHQPLEVEKYDKEHKILLAIKPGVTGMAQISGRSDLDFEEEYRLDTFYIENWSIKADLAILFKTPFTLFKKRKYS